MTFLQIIQRLTELHMDTSAEWIISQAYPKACVNDAYEYLYDILKNSEKIKRYLSLTKTKVTIVDKEVNLPADFDTIDKISTVDFTDDSWVDGDFTDRYFDFEIRWAQWSKKLVIQDEYTELWITYVPIRADMTADWDIPKLPNELHKSIADFALVEYYRRIRDNIEASNSLQLANSILSDKLKSL